MSSFSSHHLIPIPQPSDVSSRAVWAVSVSPRHKYLCGSVCWVELQKNLREWTQFHIYLTPFWHSVLIDSLNLKVVVAAFNQELALVEAFYVSIQLQTSQKFVWSSNWGWACDGGAARTNAPVSDGITTKYVATLLTFKNGEAYFLIFLA